jgi:hypothetical protein
MPSTRVRQFLRQGSLAALLAIAGAAPATAGASVAPARNTTWKSDLHCVLAEPGDWIWSSLITRDPDTDAAF